MFTGLPERLMKDVMALILESMKKEVKVIANLERKNSALIGGTILLSLKTFSSSWLTKDKYFELGASIVHIKCP